MEKEEGRKKEGSMAETETEYRPMRLATRRTCNWKWLALADV